MRRNDDNLIQIGFYSEVDEFVKEIRQKLSAVKDWGMADSLKGEISDVEDMLAGLSKTFSDGMNSKLDTKSFAAFEKKITAEVDQVKKKVDVLEATLQGLVVTFDSADSGKFSKFLSSVGADMTSLQSTVEWTVKTLKDLIEITSNSNGKVQLADSSILKSLEKEEEELRIIRDLRSQIDEMTGDETVPGSLAIKGNLDDAKKQVINFSEKLKVAQEDLSKFFNEGGTNEAKLTHLQKNLAVLTEQMGSLFQSASEHHAKHFEEIFTDEIQNVLFDAQEKVLKFEDRIKQRISDVESIRNNLGEPSALSRDKEKTTLTFPLEISTTSKSLTNEAIKIIEKSQASLAKHPLKVNFVLTSKYSSKKTNDLLKEWQSQINNIEDDELKSKFNDLYDSIVKDFQKEINFKVTPDVSTAKKDVEKLISDIKEVLKEKITLQFDIDEGAIQELQGKLDEVTAKLKFDASKIDFNDIIESIKKVSTSMQEMFGVFSNESLFEKMQTTIAGISGDLRGGDNNKLVAQLKEVLALYKQYKDMGGTNALSDLGGEKNVQKWLSKHANDEVESSNPFVVGGKNGILGYAEGIRSGIPEVMEATKEMVEAALESIRAAQNSKKAVSLGEALANEYIKGFKKGISALKKEISNTTGKAIDESLKKNIEGIKKKVSKSNDSKLDGNSSTAIKEAATAIKEEGNAASKAKKKKEGFAKANEKVAKASKKTAKETKSAAEAIQDEYEKAEKSRESVLKEEHKTRRANEKRIEKDNERNLRETQKYNRAIRQDQEAKLNNTLNKLNGSAFKKNFIEPFANEIDELKSKIGKLLSFDEINYSDIDEVIKKFNELNKVVSDPRQAGSITIAKDTQVSNLLNKITTFYKQNSAMSKESAEQIEQLISRLRNSGKLTEEEVKKIANSFNILSAEIKLADQTGASFGDTFFKHLKSANAQLLATYFSFQDFIRYLREGFQIIVQVDSALTELRKVSDASDKRLAQSFRESTKTAKELGDTISNVIGVTADWARLGYSVDDAEKLAKITTLFRTVGDNMTSEDSSSYLISTLKGFGKAADEAEEIVDVYNEVANNWAIDTAGIGEALQRSAASFYAANTDLEKAVALITATNTVVQDPASVGTLWKTLSARIRGAKTELKELDEEEDEFTETTSKLRDLVMSLTGFDILEDDLKTYKDIYEIVLGIGEKWEDLSDIEQASLAEALAGKRNSNALLAVLNNLDTLQGAYKSALEAEGSARKEQENYARSVQYSIDVLKASAQEFWTTLINSGAAKFAIDFLSKVVELLTNITDITHGTVVLSGGILLALFGKDPKRFLQNTRELLLNLNLIKDKIDATGKVVGITINSLQALKFSLVAIIATLAVIATVKAWDHMNVTVEETQKEVDELTQKISGLKSEMSELESVQSKTEAQKKRLSYLKDEIELQEKLLEIENRRRAAESVTSDYDSWVKRFTDSFDEDNLTTFLNEYISKREGQTEDDLKMFRTEFESSEKTFKPNDEFEAYSAQYEELTESLEDYENQLGSLSKGSEEYNRVSSNLLETSKKRDKVESQIRSTYGEEYADYLKLIQNLGEIDKLREGLSEDDPLQKTFDELEERYKKQIEQTRDYLIEVRELLGSDTSDLTIDERLGDANTKIAKFNKKDLQELKEYTAGFTLEEKEAWIVATEGARNAQEAIEMYEASLIKTQITAEKGVAPKFDQSKFSEQVNKLDALQSAYNTFAQNVANKETKINLDISDVDALREDFGKLKSFDEFELIVTADTSGADEIQNAFDKLLTEYANQKIALQGINESNKDMIRTQLEMEGVTHESAEAYVNAMLNRAKAEELVIEKGLALNEMTASQIMALQRLGEITPEVAKQLNLLALQEQLLNSTNLSTKDSVDALYRLGIQAGFTGAQLQVLYEIMNMLDQADAVESKSGVAAQEIKKAAEAKLRNFNALVQEKLNENLSVSFDYGGAIKDAGGGGGEAGDAYVEAYEKELKQLEDLRDRGLISEKEYLNRLKDLIDKYFKDREQYAEKYAEELKKYMDQMLSYYNSVISGVTTLLDKRINALQKNKDTAVDVLNAEKEAAEENYQAQIDAIQDQMDALDDLIDKKNEEIDALNEQIDAINEANEARDRSINLQKAEYELQRMQNQRTKLVYTGEVGQMRYERDESGVRDAQENLRDAQDEIAIAAIEKQIKLIEDEIALLEKEKEALSGQQEALQEAMESSSKYYEKLIKEQEKFFDDQVKALEETKAKWEELAAIEEVSKAWGLVSNEMAEYGYTVEDVLNDVPGAFETFKDKYISVLQEMHSGDQGFLDGLKQSTSELPEAFGKVTSSASEAQKPIADLSTAANTASTNVSTLGTSAATASTGVSSLKTASSGISENIEGLSNVTSFDGLNTALGEVETILTRIKDLLGGAGEIGPTSILGAISALNNNVDLKNIKQSFLDLAGAISGALSALSGGAFISAGFAPTQMLNENVSETGGGGGLISGIQRIKDAAQEYVGINSEEEADNAIGSFVALLEAINRILVLIGVDEKQADEATLLFSINHISEVSQEAINGEAGAVSAFEDLRVKIEEVLKLAKKLLETIESLSSAELPDLDTHVSSSGNEHGGSHGLAKAQGDSNVKNGGRSLVGELGPEIVVRDNKYKVVGTNGPEFVNLKKGDIVLNSKETKELFDKKNLHGKAFAEGSGFSPFNFSDSYTALLNMVKTMDLPTMSELKTSIDSLGRTIQSEIQNVAMTKTDVIQNNTFNISGVTGEEVAEKINSTLLHTFSGMSLNAYQRSMA